jgi:hypothetical protein
VEVTKIYCGSQQTAFAYHPQLTGPNRFFSTEARKNGDEGTNTHPQNDGQGKL